MKRICHLSFLLAFLPALIFPVSAVAQRQTPGRPSVEAYMNISGVPFGTAGGGAAWCNYNYNGHTVLGLDVYVHPRSLEEGAIVMDGEQVAPAVMHTLGCEDICFMGGYFWRLLAPRSRVVILSAGVTGLVGVSHCGAIASFYNESKGSNYGPVGFVLGVMPELKLEAFPLRSASVYVSARPRVRIISTLGGGDRWLQLNYCLGVRYYL